MISTKSFLSQECDSVRSVLNETLRYKYGSDGSRDFFEECEVRLNFIRDELLLVSDNEHSKLRALGALLTEISILISWIERSSISEYSWPFVEELKKIAFAICTENTIDDPSAPPKIHVMSEGGVARYAIAAELKRPFPSKRRILTIIFPRSLKHFVLLHPLLGHELGHAIWRGSEHEKKLKEIIQKNLLSQNSSMMNATSAASWLFSQQAPQTIKDDLANLSKQGINQGNFFQHASWEAWIEEITCDLIGLLTFGPSFIAAHCQALNGVVPSGGGFGTQHPPVGCRINMMLVAAAQLNLSNIQLQDASLTQMAALFWKKLNEKKQQDSWFDIFPDAVLNSTIQEISSLLELHSPARYPSPDPVQLSSLLSKTSNQIPPVGFAVDEHKNIRCTRVDFRHILYAGWIAAANQPPEAFLMLNQLCEHGIMQQQAINLHLT